MSKAVFSLEPALELELEISETRFGLLPEDLFRLAVRQNTQRAFLFVSKVLGKHLPVEPAALLAAGKLLALAWLDQKDEQGWAGILKGSTASPFPEVWDRLEHSRYSLGMEDRALFLRRYWNGESVKDLASGGLLRRGDGLHQHNPCGPCRRLPAHL